MNGNLTRFARFLPSPGDAVFGFVLGLTLIGGRFGLLNDPGTPWHLRLGREILATGGVPRSDTLTFTHEASLGRSVVGIRRPARTGRGPLGLVSRDRPGLARAGMALPSDGARLDPGRNLARHRSGCFGLRGVYRRHPFPDPPTPLHVRVPLPHASCLPGSAPARGWAVLKVTIYTAVLANLHGGFVALPLIVATAGLGHAVSGAWDAARRQNVTRFAAAFLVSCLAALANPYGFGLYRHVAGLLVSSGVTSLIIEYQPPHFGTPEAEVLEWVLLALVGLPVVSQRRFDRYQLCHVLVWLHLALTSIRNAPLFALVLRRARNADRWLADSPSARRGSDRPSRRSSPPSRHRPCCCW